MSHVQGNIDSQGTDIVRIVDGIGLGLLDGFDIYMVVPLADKAKHHEGTRALHRVRALR